MSIEQFVPTFKLGVPMNYQKLIATVFALTPVAGMAADDLSYTYLQADYINLDIDDVGDNGDVLDDFDNGNGYAVRGSFGFGNNWFVFGDYSKTDADVSFFDDLDMLQPGEADVKKLDLGVGTALPLNDTSDLVLRGAYTDTDIGDFDFGGSDDSSLDDLNDDGSDGYFVDGSWRSQVSPNIEVSLGGRYTDIENIDGLSFIGGVLFEFREGLGVSLQVDAGDELSTYSAGLRFSI
jgi:hypothetical protein